MGVVIRIIDTGNNVLGDLDLTDFKDFPLALTKGIVNLDNLKARTGTYSKTFKVPNTKNNSELLSDIDNINSRKDYRDALGRKPCVIIVDNNENDKGFIQVSKVTNKDYYELVFFGNNIDWVKGASELKLVNIPFLNNSQTYDQTDINTANSSTSDTYDHAYPYVSRGGNTSANNTIVRDYTPVFYVPNLITRGLNSLGWNVSSSFLADSVIKRMVADFSLKFKVTDDEVADTKVRAQKTTAATAIPFNTSVTVDFEDDFSTPNEDVNGLYNTTTFEYTPSISASYDFNIGIGILNPATYLIGDITVRILRNATDPNDFTTGETLWFQQNSFGNNGGRFSYTPQGIVLNAGDNITISVNNGSRDQQDLDIIPTVAGFGAFDTTYFNVQRRSEIFTGDNFTLNSVIPTDIKLLDVINDFTRMHNIYYWSDVKTKTIYLEPRDDFFKPITESVDWTDKIDFSKNYVIDYVNTYKRNITFSYKDLNSDEWLKEWQKVNKRTYGSYNHVMPNRFAEGTTKIGLDLFSASYAVDAKEATPLNNGVFDSEIVFTTIRAWGEYLTQNEPLERISDYNPKIYIFNNGTQESVGGTSRQINKFGSSSTTIPYGIFETYNNTTSDKNLSFTGDNGLFATHYSNMLKNIEEGGRLIAYVKLDNVDVDNLDFRKLVYISTPSEITGYYIIEKVEDFKPLEDGTTKVSLFKFEDLGNVAIDGSQQGNNGNNTDNGNNTPPLNPVYVIDNNQIIDVVVFDQTTQNFEQVYL
tara:strand:- start:238 stop:2508 length:2271 start_codon:yes stop_codon:yes gene_type:complete